MPEHVAVVGSRHGADLAAVRSFVTSLHGKYPDTVLLSGGAEGVDKIAEQTWLALGGKVVSLRAKTLKAYEEYGVECWELGGDLPKVYPLRDHLTFADYRSALLYRDTLLAERADRIVAFVRRGGSAGADFTFNWGIDVQRKPRYRYEAA